MPQNETEGGREKRERRRAGCSLLLFLRLCTTKTFFFFPAFHLSSSLFLRVSLPSVVVVVEFQFGKKGETRREIGLLSGSKWRQKCDIFSYCSQWLRLHVLYIFYLVKFKWNLKSDVISALSSPPFFSSSCIPPTISFFSTTISRHKRTKIEGKYCSFYLRKVETREEGHLNFLIRRLRQHRGSYLFITKKGGFFATDRERWKLCLPFPSIPYLLPFSAPCHKSLLILSPCSLHEATTAGLVRPLKFPRGLSPRPGLYT